MRLVLAVHGTASPSGQQVYRPLAARTAEHVPTALAHLDVQTPTLDDVVREGDVVVPVLPARSYDLRVDCAAAVQHGASWRRRSVPSRPYRARRPPAARRRCGRRLAGAVRRRRQPRPARSA